jgi:hypothetical protein
MASLSYQFAVEWFMDGLTPSNIQIATTVPTVPKNRK